MKEKIEEFLKASIEKGIFPGCAFGVIAGHQKITGAVGKLTYDTESPYVNEESIYDVASVTKTIPTSSLALKLIEEKLISFDNLLIDIIPEYKGNYREEINIYHLLSHSLDFGFALSSLKNKSPNEIIDFILNANLCSPPGSNFSYSNTTSILLGMVLERVTGLPLDRLSEKIFFSPLNMKKTSFHPEELEKSQIAPSEIDPWRGGIVQGVVHDESAYAMRPRVVGSAGLFSTVMDLMNFVEMLLNNGEYNGKIFFSEISLRLIYSNHIKKNFPISSGGWELKNPSFMGERCSHLCFGKTGFTGCSVVIDPLKKIGIILLSNHTFPKRRKDRSVINEIRREMADLVYLYYGK
ncbi:MAG: beta-lactamase family protein [Chitinispirillaceae bacterium]|nr:beta-lactamase family protein [Chitinispirillaceae bacterium]